VNYQKARGTSAHSLTDNSDGLIAELESISYSSHVSIDIYSSLIPTDAHTLHGGEDHIFVGTFESCPDGWIEIGKVNLGSGVTLDGKSITHEGFKHF
jgi:thiamine-monophosphate kinase